MKVLEESIAALKAAQSSWGRVQLLPFDLSRQISTDKDKKDYCAYLNCIMNHVDVSQHHGGKIRSALWDPAWVSVLGPLVGWVSKVDIEPLMKPAAKYLEVWLEEAAAKVPAFQSAPALKAMWELWIGHLLPLVLETCVGQVSVREEWIRDVTGMAVLLIKDRMGKLLKEVHKKESEALKVLLLTFGMCLLFCLELSFVQLHACICNQTLASRVS